MGVPSLQFSVPTSSVDRFLTGGTGGLLLFAPALTLHQDLWPFYVVATLLASGGLFALWFRDVLTTPQVLSGAVLLRLVYLPLLPELTDDPYRYLWDGLLQVKGINPYRFVPSADALKQLRDGVLFERMNSPSYYSIYPPLSQIVFAIGGLGAQWDWRLGYYLIKLIFVGAELGGVVLLASLTSARALLLYAWNPLVLMETAGQGHTEALLVPLLVVAVWSIRRGQPAVASGAMVGAGMVKLYPFLLWPLVLRRGGKRALWVGGLVVVLFSLPYAAPYVISNIKSSVDLFSRLFEFNAGPYYLVKHVLWEVTNADWSKTIGPLFRGVFLVCVPFLYLIDWWHEWSLRRGCMTVIGLLFVLSTTVHPWYLLPVVALGVLGTTPAWPWLWLGALSTGTYLYYVGGPYWVWIVLGWGGAAALGAWRYRDLIQRMFGNTIMSSSTGA